VQRIALIDYGAGNLRSVQSALEAALGQTCLGGDVVMTDDPDVVRKADRIVLPGQGAFDDCMNGLLARPGLADALQEAVLGRALPFLGICVGMQLLADVGLEHGECRGLGWLGGVCRPLMAGPQDRVPHMGWNEAVVSRPHPVLAPLAPKRHVYYCHSYVLEPPADVVLASTEHGERFCAAAGRDNIVGVQFHPEKSQTAGLETLARFIDWMP
jgi:glutamine amidotransferase